MTSLLNVDNLFVTRTPDGRPILSGISFCLAPGEGLIILGESGSGKTILTRALTHLFHPDQPFTVTGSVTFNGVQLSRLPPADLLRLRRRSIRYIFQEPGGALNPLGTIRSQMALAADPEVRDEQLLAAALGQVGIADTADVLRSFPHQLSTGTAQRVMIAMALLPAPALLIADEPTSAVDADRKGTIIELLLKRRRESGMAMIITTHDPGVAGALGDRVITLLGGTAVETGPAKEVLSSPFHPYVQELLGTAPPQVAPDRATIDRAKATEERIDPDRGCVYAGRCPKSREQCLTSEPVLESAGPGREVRCFFWK